MNKIHRIVLAVVLCLAGVSAMGQSVSPVDFMRLNPYQLNSNAATDLPYRCYFSFLAGNFTLNVENTGLHYDNFFDFNAQGRPEVLNLKKLANSLKTENRFGFGFNENLFSFGHSVGDNGMLTFGYNIKLQSDMRYSDGLFKLLAYGNSAFVGEDNPANMDVSFNLKAYREFAVGYQRNITDKLSIGGRAKVLFGLANVSTDVFNAKLYTDPETYALRFEENVAVQASVPGVEIIDADGALNPIFNFGLSDLFRNPGFGVDLAAEYRFNDRFGMVLAVNDLGFIRWGGNNIRLTSGITDAGQFYDEGSFLFEGLNVDQIESLISDEQYQGQFFDTLKQYFQLEFKPMGRYKTMLNTDILLRGYCDLDEHNRFTAQVQGCFLGSGFRPAMTVAYNGSFGNVFDVCVTYTMMKNSYSNVGLGLGLKLGIFNLYATTSNFISFFDAMNGKTLNVQVGLVFNLSKK